MGEETYHREKGVDNLGKILVAGKIGLEEPLNLPFEKENEKMI